ncbi:MAG TPA: MFS transporter [Ktedonobacteraceae bacterium]|nr:MFS transporter [Ktedonobacteraceae bacterium]
MSEPTLSAPAPVQKAYGGITRQPLFIFGLCLLGWTLAQMDQAFFGFVIPQVAKEFHLTLGDIGLILAITSVATGIGVVVWGILTDRLGRKPVFQITLIFYAIFTALQGLAPGAVTFTIARGLAGIGTGGEAPLTNTIVAEESPARWRGVLTGILQIGYPLGWFIASLITVPIVLAYGWRAVFFVGIVPALFIIVLRVAFKETRRFEALKAVREGKIAAEQTNVVASKEKAERVSLSELFSPELRRTTIVLFIATFLWAGAYGGIAFYLPTYLQAVKGFTFAQATYLTGIAYGIAVIGYISASFVGEFVLTRRNTMIIWAVLGAVGFAGLLWLANGWLTVFLWFTFMSIFFYGTAAIEGLLVTECYPTRIRATGASFTGSLAVALGLGIFPLITGNMIGAVGWNQTMLFFVIIPLLLSAAVLLLARNVKSGVEVETIAV